MKYRVTRTIVYEGDLPWLERTLASSIREGIGSRGELGPGRVIYEKEIVGPVPIREPAPTS